MMNRVVSLLFLTVHMYLYILINTLHVCSVTACVISYNVNNVTCVCVFVPKLVVT